MKTMITIGAIAAAASLATAGGFTTEYNDSLTGFGSSLDAFVGDGIPNSNMVVTRGGGIQVGLKAIERFIGDLPTNAAGDTYIAQPGFSPTSASNPTPSTNASWNYVYAIDLGQSQLTLGDVKIDFYIDFDPSAASDFIHIDVSDFIAANGLNSLTRLGDSQNLAFNFWSTIFGTSFDPSAAGLYDFRLTVSNFDRTEVLTDNLMTVQVVPLPPAAWAGLAMLGGIVGVRKLRRR